MQPDQQKTCQGEKVLIITGDVTFGEGLNKALCDIGYDSKFYKDGNDGLKAMFDTIPHLILVDIDLPSIDGYSILEKKQAEPLLAKIPVFLMSTQGVPINMRRVPQGSVKEFVVTLRADVADVVGRIDKHFGCAPENKIETNSETGKKILWVEDDKLIGSILGKKLLNSGFNLTHCKNGEEAMKELEQAIPDAIMIDLLLPGMSGFDILKQIRDNAKFKDVPIMILSNLSKASDINRAKVLGAQKFLVKATASLDQIVAEVRALAK